MLKTIALILVGLWLLSLVVNIASGVIHLLLVIALVVLAYDLLAGRRARS